VGQRLDAAEAQADVLHVEDHVADAVRSSRAHGLRGVGRDAQRQPGLQRRRGAGHAALRTVGNVLASTIFRSAATTPVRPSSNFTCVSMYWLALPPYSASTSTW